MMAVENTTALEQVHIRLAPLPCGLVIFDTPEAKHGTAFLPQTDPQRVRSANDLRNDVLWISNLSPLEPITHVYPNLRSDFYFRRKIWEIGHDLGIQSSSTGQIGPEDAALISTFLTRTMTIAARAYGWDVSEMGPMRVTEPYLERDIAKMQSTPPKPDARIESTVSRAITQAYQEFSAPRISQYDWQPDTISVTLRFNEVNYVRQIMECMVPKGLGWTYVHQGIKLSQRNLLDFCCNRPTIAKATVEWDNTPSDMVALAAYGMSGNTRGTMRLWLSQPELLWLSRYATITIHSFWIDQSGLGAVDAAAQLPALLRNRPEAALSYSAGLVAYNHFVGLTSAGWNQNHKTKESSAWATWFRAIDRSMMFAMALSAHKAGFHIERYGLGSLRIRVQRERLPELKAFKEQFGFMYPDLESLNEKE